MYRNLLAFSITLAFVAGMVCLQPAGGQDKVRKDGAGSKADKPPRKPLEEVGGSGFQSKTKHKYKIGYKIGRSQARVRFMRLQYSGGDWDRSIGDKNMLAEYGLRMKQSVAREGETLTIAKLKRFAPRKSPPLVYLTGKKTIRLTDAQINILREYLLKKHGMLFGDNGGSKQFHNQFVAMMAKILPKVRPVPVPLDDSIHQVPYALPFLPFVVLHGGKHALGWKVDGRWVCYYHPGNLGAAWADDHAGVSRSAYEACYQLGTNIIFYAHLQHARWRAGDKELPEVKGAESPLEKLLDRPGN